MLILNRKATLDKLKARQAAIVHESDEDEGAAEHHAEIQSVIDVVDSYGHDMASDTQIREAAAWVGLDSDVVFTES